MKSILIYIKTTACIWCWDMLYQSDGWNKKWPSKMFDSITMQFQLPPSNLSADLTSNHGAVNILSNVVILVFYPSNMYRTLTVHVSFEDIMTSPIQCLSAQFTTTLHDIWWMLSEDIHSEKLILILMSRMIPSILLKKQQSFLTTRVWLCCFFLFLFLLTYICRFALGQLIKYQKIEFLHVFPIFQVGFRIQGVALTGLRIDKLNVKAVPNRLYKGFRALTHAGLYEVRS